MLGLFLRRKRVKGRAYIHEWQSHVELRNYTYPHYRRLSALGVFGVLAGESFYSLIV